MAVLPNDTVIAGYRIDGPLGEGGMGTVYRATQLSLERVVALKLLTSDLSGDAGFRERFRREGLLQAALDHPHIVTVYEAGQTEYGLFLAMRVVDGPTLKKLIQTKQQGDRRSLRLLTQVADALDSAHAKGLIHRDVKPQNVLVGAGDHAYLADFGLTRAAGDTGVTETGHFVGTIDYISPEQARGELATPQSDVYALTAVLYECLTGQVPFVRTSEERVLIAHLTEPPPKVTDIRHDLPPAIDDVIARGMAKDPDDRPRTCSELMLEARRALGAPGPAPAANAADATRLGTVTPLDGAEEGIEGATRLAGAVTVPAAGAATAPRTPAPTAPRGAGAAAAAGAAARGATAGSAAAQATAEPTVARGAEQTRRRRARVLVAAVAVFALAALAVGLLAGKHSSPPATSAFTNTASAGNIELSYPSTWRRLPSVPAIGGLALSDSLALQTASVGRVAPQTLVAGHSSANGPALLPASLLSQLDGVLPHAQAVRLGATEAYRYDGLKLKGASEPLTVFTVPTTAGVATIVCMGQLQPAESAPPTACEEIAATLRLSGASPYPLAPSASYASALSVALSRLNNNAATASGELQSATSAHDQAAAAERIAAAYRAGAGDIAGLPVSPAITSLNAAIASSLHKLADDYSTLATAARHADKAAYAAASEAAAADSRSLSAALHKLNSAGYAVSG